MEESNLDIKSAAFAGLALGIFLVITMATFFPFVDRVDTDTKRIWVSYSPIQCADDPWTNFDYSRLPAEYGNGIIAYAYAAAKTYEQKGIVVYDFAVVGSNRLVLAVCGFVSSYDVLLQVPELQKYRMMLAGFKEHQAPNFEERLKLSGNIAVLDFNYSNARPYRDVEQYFTQESMKQAVQRALLQPITEKFFESYSAKGIYTSLDYYTAQKVSTLKQNNRAYAFLPDSEVIHVFFASPRGPIEEFPMLSVYVDAKTFDFVGYSKAFW